MYPFMDNDGGGGASIGVVTTTASMIEIRTHLQADSSIYGQLYAGDQGGSVRGESN
jgi:hypothetical protein